MTAKMFAQQAQRTFAKSVDDWGSVIRLQDGTELKAVPDEKPEAVKEEMLLRTTGAIAGRMGLFHFKPSDADTIPEGTAISYAGEKWNLYPRREIAPCDIRVTATYLATTGAIE